MQQRLFLLTGANRRPEGRDIDGRCQVLWVVIRVLALKVTAGVDGVGDCLAIAYSLLVEPWNSRVAVNDKPGVARVVSLPLGTKSFRTEVVMPWRCQALVEAIAWRRIKYQNQFKSGPCQVTYPKT